MTGARASPDYRVVAFRDEHRAAVANLQRHLWSPDPARNAAYLEWKYLRNPYIAEPLIYLAFDRDELIGMRGAFGTCWEAGEATERFTLPYPDDFVLEPAHRGHWLQQRIMTFAFADMAKRGYRYAVNLSASRATAAGSLRMKWRKAGGVQPLHRRTTGEAVAGRVAGFLEQQKLLWRWADRLPALCLESGAQSFARLDRRFARASRASALFLSREPLVGEMAELVRRSPADGRIRHVRDEAFLDWRYRNPLHDYRFIYAGAGRLEGFLVLQRLVKDGGRRVCIVDWEAADDRIRGELLDAAVANDFAELYTWGSGACPAAAQATVRSGFVPAAGEFETSIMVRPVRDEDLAAPWILAGRRLDDPASWDLRMVYSARG